MNTKIDIYALIEQNNSSAQLLLIAAQNARSRANRLERAIQHALRLSDTDWPAAQEVLESAINTAPL